MNLQNMASSMPMIVRLELPSQHVQSMGDVIGAFVHDDQGNEQCVGQILPMDTEEGLLYFLSTFGGAHTPSDLTFRWKSNLSGVELIADEMTTFNASELKGSPTEPLPVALQPRGNGTQSGTNGRARRLSKSVCQRAHHSLAWRKCSRASGHRRCQRPTHCSIGLRRLTHGPLPMGIKPVGKRSLLRSRHHGTRTKCCTRCQITRFPFSYLREGEFYLSLCNQTNRHAVANNSSPIWALDRLVRSSGFGPMPQCCIPRLLRRTLWRRVAQRTIFHPRREQRIGLHSIGHCAAEQTENWSSANSMAEEAIGMKATSLVKRIKFHLPRESPLIV